MPTIIEQSSGNAGVEQTLRTMMALVNGAIADPLIRAQAVQATKHCARHDIPCMCASMLQWVKRSLRFVNDPDGVEALSDPRLVAKAIQEKRLVYGDCDDFSMYLAALLKSIGLKPQLRAVGYEGKPYQHVYVTCNGMKLDATRDEWNTQLGLTKRETSAMNLDLGSGQLMLGDFFGDLGKMFTRMVKFTPKSFTPGNILEGVANTTLATMTGGLIYAAPKNIRTMATNIAKVAVPVVAAGVGMHLLAPSVIPTLAAKLSSASGALGKAIGTIGSSLINNMAKMPASTQAQIAQAVTPQDIVQMEQTGQVPANLQSLFMQGAQQGYYPPSPPLQVGPLTEEYYAQPPVQQAGMFGGMNMETMMMVLGVTAIMVLAFQSPGRRR